MRRRRGGRRPVRRSRPRRRRGRLGLGLLVLAALAALGGWLFTGAGGSLTDGGDSSKKGEVLDAPALRPLPGSPERAARRPPPGISLNAGPAVDMPFKAPPRAGLLFDVKTGKVLWSRHPLKPMPIASLTKMMTALVVVQNARPDEEVRIRHNSKLIPGSKVGVLPKRKDVRLEPLLYGLMLPSGNDAAVALAEHVGGTQRKFARMMNRKAREMGLGCTRFSSAYGLQPSNRSCAADLAAIARADMSERRIARIVGRRSAHPRFPIKGGHLFVNNTNPLLKQNYPGTIGLKTGDTQEAGLCFVAIVRHGSRDLGVVLLGSPNPAEQSKKLFKAGFRALRPRA
jgi:serine-type D-Ala-D-Ala carboxypeptidase (penicillin-binding protein 5/6)